MYRFETNNGCSRCDAMDGLYDDEPARPHDYCRCIISVVEDEDTDLTSPTSGKPGSFSGRSGDGWSWTWDDPTNTVYNSDEDGDGYAETYRMEGLLSVECCDGETVTGDDYDLVVHVDLSQGTTREEQDALMEEALQEAEVEMRDRARELRERDCDCEQIVS